MSTYDSEIGAMRPDFSGYTLVDGPTSHDDNEAAPVVNNTEWQRIRLAAVACFVLRKVNRLEALRAEAEALDGIDLKLLIDGLIERAGK